MNNIVILASEPDEFTSLLGSILLEQGYNITIFYKKLTKRILFSTHYKKLINKLQHFKYINRLEQIEILNDILNRLFITQALTINAHGDSLLMPAHISYIHGLTPFLYDPRIKSYCDYEELLKVLPSAGGVKVLLRRGISPFLFKLSLKISRIVAVNSTFIRRGLEILGIKSIVIYPPIEIHNYIALNRELADRDDLVVTISEFRKDKSLERILLIAKMVKNAKFIIIGKIIDKQYYITIEKLIRKYNLKDKVLLYPDAPSSTLLSILRRAKVYLHTRVCEPFGRAIVEAMAAGLVPVVHMSGGPYHDILGNTSGLWGFAYKSLEEAYSYIQELLTNDKLRTEIARKVVSRSKLFGVESFEKSLIKVIKAIQEQYFYKSL